MERARKDLSEIYSRLFDHRPIIQADIRFFIREFEEKRGFREQRGLVGMHSLMVELNDQIVPKTREAMCSNVPSVLAKLEAANHITSRIQQREQEADQERFPSKGAYAKQLPRVVQRCDLSILGQSSSPMKDERLHDSRERRKAEWAAFVTDQRRQSSELEEEHAKAAEWLKGQYAAMAKDLAKFRTF